MTKWQLFNAMTGNGQISIGGVSGCIVSVEREDGSGSSFNVKLRYGTPYGDRIGTFYIRTID